MRTTVLVYLVCLAIVDVLIPLPILALVLIGVTVRRPAWFRSLVRQVYGED